MRRYSLYGLDFTSDWPLPYRQLRGGHRADLRFVEASPELFARAASDDGRPPPASEWFRQRQLDDGSTYLRWRRHFEFVISADGCCIAGRPLHRAAPEAFHSYLLGHVLSYVLLKRGLDPLHGTVVVVDGAAVAFIGDCGYGKSSIAAAFIATGHRLLTDDLLVVRPASDGFTVFPGPPRIKLWPQIAAAVFEGGAHGVPMNRFTPKLIVPLGPHQVHPAPAPLRAIYVLARPGGGGRSSRVFIRRVSARRSFVALLRNTFNAHMRQPDRLERQFRQASRIALSIPVKMLSYRRQVGLLPEVQRAVLADLDG